MVGIPKEEALNARVIHPKHSLGKFVTESLTVQMDSEK
jgi:hypothetical protein